MNIAKAVMTDIDQIISLIGRATDELQKNGIDQWDEIYPNKEVITGDVSAGTLYKIILDKNIAGIVALNEEQPIEYQSLSWKDNGGRPIIVHRLCVHPNFQGKGLAKQLMRFAEDNARLNNYSSIRLEAFSDNFIAQKLYDSLKYQRVGYVKFIKGNFVCFEKVI